MVPVVGHCDEEELTDFAHAEMAGADFGDERINRRASKIVSSFAARPQSSIPAASEDWAGAKGAYRFFSNPRVTPEKILEPHLDKAVERCAGEDLVLAIGDTTLLDFTSRKAMSGTGPLSGREPHGLGLLVHTTLLASENGVPLGVADNLVWSRSEEGFGDRAQRCKTLPRYRSRLLPSVRRPSVEPARSSFLPCTPRRSLRAERATGSSGSC